MALTVHTVAGSGQLNVTWSGPVATGLRGYQVQWRRHGATDWVNHVVSATTAAYTITPLLDGVAYDWSVVPLYAGAGGAGGTTKTLAGSAPLPAPTSWPSPTRWP